MKSAAPSAQAHIERNAPADRGVGTATQSATRCHDGVAATQDVERISVDSDRSQTIGISTTTQQAANLNTPESPASPEYSASQAHALSSSGTVWVADVMLRDSEPDEDEGEECEQPVQPPPALRSERSINARTNESATSITSSKQHGIDASNIIGINSINGIHDSKTEDMRTSAASVPPSSASSKTSIGNGVANSIPEYAEDGHLARTYSNKSESVSVVSESTTSSSRLGFLRRIMMKRPSDKQSAAPTSVSSVSRPTSATSVASAVSSLGVSGTSEDGGTSSSSSTFPPVTGLSPSSRKSSGFLKLMRKGSSSSSATSPPSSQRKHADTNSSNADASGEEGKIFEEMDPQLPPSDAGSTIVKVNNSTKINNQETHGSTRTAQSYSNRSTSSLDFIPPDVMDSHMRRPPATAPAPATTPAVSQASTSPKRVVPITTFAEAEAARAAAAGGSVDGVAPGGVGSLPVAVQSYPRPSPGSAPAYGIGPYRELDGQLSAVTRQVDAGVRDREPSVSSPVQSAYIDPELEYVEQLFSGKSVPAANLTAWLGDTDRPEKVRDAYMSHFDWESLSILGSLRLLCEHIYFRGESQHIDRILQAFANRWCICNPTHSMYNKDVVYMVAYSTILLNTDHHAVTEGNLLRKKMTKQQFLNSTVKAVYSLIAPDDDVPSFSASSSSSSSSESDQTLLVSGGPSFESERRAWLGAFESLLRSIFLSISKTALSLLDDSASGVDGVGGDLSDGRRYGSTTSPQSSARELRGARSVDALTRSDESLSTSHGLSSSLFVNPSMDSSSLQSSSTGPVGIAGSLQVGQVGTEKLEFGAGNSFTPAPSVAPTMSGAIIGQDLISTELELCGSPWAKEGILKHKLQPVVVEERKARNKGWEEVFVVVQRGYLKAFKFAATSSSSRSRSNGQQVVGGGNWSDKANMIQSIRLNQTLSSFATSSGKPLSSASVTLASAGKVTESLKSWMLTMPDGTAHLFQSGTPEISEEFVNCCNYWAARLSKEPLSGGVSNIEYGWSHNILEALGISVRRNSSSSSSTSSKNSFQSTHKTIGPENSVFVRDWEAPPINLLISKLDEDAQLNALALYTHVIGEEIERHSSARREVINQLPRSFVYRYKATKNWERKSIYLLHELAKYTTYVKALQGSVLAQRRMILSANREASGPIST
ncbi:hypothetical protein V1511DRAFT_375668 [Dipodascopsis uninucleata]